MTPSEIEEMNPAIRTDGLVGGIFCPTDGFIRPMEVLRGYVEGATRFGVRFDYGVECADFELDGLGRISTVRTSGGDVAAGEVVNAAGALAPGGAGGAGGWSGTPRRTTPQAGGGYAEYTVADQRYCFPIPESYSDAEAAPLLCAGLIGYRSLVKAGEGKRLGIYGFGAAAHIVAQVARYQKREIYAFTRPGDEQAKRFALGLGAVWAGGSNESPPVTLDAAISVAARWRACTPCASHRGQRRHRRLRRHTHERHPVFPLLNFVGRTFHLFSRQPHPSRR